MTRTKVHGLLALALVLASVAAAAPASAAKPLAPLMDGGTKAVPDQYIVVLKDTMAASAVDSVAEAAVSHGGTLRVRYSRLLNGFAAKLPGKALEAVRANPAVAYVTPDSIIEPTTDQTNPPSWGLDRIDQRPGQPFLDNLYRYDSTGAGATVFVVDTGIRATHTDFGGRATGVFDAVGDGHGTDDCFNHGTHVAGTIGGTTFGVAKGVQIRAVRVIGCEGGVSSDLIEGMEFIAGNHPPRSVVNFSLNIPDPAAAQALEGLIDAGIHAVVAAGNADSDACTANPITNVSRVVTVAASVQGDGRAFFSNFGTCVDVFAPGLGIISASPTSDTASQSMSGTSMAAPHVSGWIARYLEEIPTATPAQSLAAIISSSSKGIIGYSQIGPGTPNRLLFADPLANTPPDTTPPSTPGQPTIGFVTETEVEVRFPAATDNVAIAGYDMFQRFGGTETLIARLPAGGLSFAPSGLSPGSTYSFYVKARDTAENFSAPSPTVTITTAGAHTCRVQYQINGTNPFNANLVVTNNGPATIAGWRLQFPFPDGQQLVPGQNWGATWTQDGNFVTAANLPWNELIPPGSSAFIGFNATQTGTNSVPGFFNFNGVFCTIG